MADGGTSGDRLGASVAIADGIVVAGAPFDDEIGAIAGAAYLFDAATGRQLLKLLPDEGSILTFGCSVAIADGVVAVGSPYEDNGQLDDTGAVYLFEASTGRKLHKLFASNSWHHDQMGESLAILDGVVAAGAPNHDPTGGALGPAGAAYLFDVSSGQQLKKLISDLASGHEYATSIALTGGYVVGGAPYDVDAGPYPNPAGAAFLHNATTGQMIDKVHPTGTEPEGFGSSVAGADGLVAIAGREMIDDVEQVAIDLIDGATSDSIAKFLSSSPAGFAGQLSVAMADGIVVGGQLTDDQLGQLAGAAYIFSVPPPCLADVNGDGQLTILDFIVFQVYWQKQDSIADCDANGVFNVLDFVCFQSLFQQGCP